MEEQGHEVVSLVSIIPEDLYSWLFHTPNLALIPQMAEAMGKEYHAIKSQGEGDEELSALQEVLQTLEVEGVITGAIASDYQWDRINQVCEDLQLKVFSPLWKKDPLMLMETMIASGIKAVITTVAAEGLDKTWLGRELNTETLEELKKLQQKYGVSVSGEGGEYESLTLDSPLHKKSLVIKSVKIIEARDNARMEVNEVELQDK